MSILSISFPGSVYAEQSFNFESNELKVYNQEGKALFEGNVRAWNDTGSIQANRLEVYYHSAGDTVRHIIAFGDVKLSYPDFTTESEYAFRDVQNDTILLQQQAYVKRKNNEIWADWILLNLRDDFLHVKEVKKGKIISTGKGLFDSAQ